MGLGDFEAQTVDDAQGPDGAPEATEATDTTGDGPDEVPEVVVANNAAPAAHEDPPALPEEGSDDGGVKGGWKVEWLLERVGIHGAAPDW